MFSPGETVIVLTPASKTIGVVSTRLLLNQSDVVFEVLLGDRTWRTCFADDLAAAPKVRQ